MEISNLKSQIFAFDDRAPVKVHEWGQDLFIVPMSGTDRDSYDLELHRAKEAGEELSNWRARFLVRCLFQRTTDNGPLTRVFADSDAEKLGQKNADTIRRLFEIASQVNGTAPGAVEDAAKNFSGEAAASASPG